MTNTREMLIAYLKNDKFYQVQDGELAFDANGKSIQISLLPFKSFAEGYVETRRVIGVVLLGDVYIVPNTPNNHFRLSEVLYERSDLPNIQYLHGEKPARRNEVLEEIL